MRGWGVSQSWSLDLSVKKVTIFSLERFQQGKCGENSLKEGNRSEEPHLIYFDEDDHCDQQRLWMPNIRFTTNSTTGTIDPSYYKQYLYIIINLKSKVKGYIIMDIYACQGIQLRISYAIFHRENQKNRFLEKFPPKVSRYLYTLVIFNFKF